MRDAQPRLFGVLETVLYYETEQEAEVESFYRDVLGLRPVVESIGGTAYRAGRDVFLVFDRPTKAKLGELTHGTTGSTHTCFLAAADEYESWKEHLREQGVTLIEETTWRSGVRSFYFRDPAGNLLEIAEADLWPA